MAGGIFISYRRADSAPWAGRLYENLAREFDKARVFMDVDNILPGQPFPKALEQALAECDVIICLIGRHWLAAVDEAGNRRLDDPGDFVRFEMRQALARTKSTIIPVLVDSAQMPNERELPADLHALASLNAVELTHARFASDFRLIIDAIRRNPNRFFSPYDTSGDRLLAAGWSITQYVFWTGGLPLFVFGAVHASGSRIAQLLGAQRNSFGQITDYVPASAVGFFLFLLLVALARSRVIRTHRVRVIGVWLAGLVGLVTSILYAILEIEKSLPNYFPEWLPRLWLLAG